MMGDNNGTELRWDDELLGYIVWKGEKGDKQKFSMMIESENN